MANECAGVPCSKPARGAASANMQQRLVYPVLLVYLACLASPRLANRRYY